MPEQAESPWKQTAFSGTLHCVFSSQVQACWSIQPLQLYALCYIICTPYVSLLPLMCLNLGNTSHHGEAIMNKRYRLWLPCSNRQGVKSCYRLNRYIIFYVFPCFLAVTKIKILEAFRLNTALEPSKQLHKTHWDTQLNRVEYHIKCQDCMLASNWFQ